jgi:hypothetical protein
MRLVFSAALVLLPALLCAAQAPEEPYRHRPLPDRAVCMEQELAAIKQKLPEDLAHLRARVSSCSAAELDADQQSWLAWLPHVCPTRFEDETSCLQSRYQERDSQLTQGAQDIQGKLVFTRAHFTLVPGKLTRDSSGTDPGFGVGTFTWPEIDRPTDAQAAFNRAVHEAALALALGKDHPQTFDPAVDASGTIDLFSGLRAFNNRLIEIDFSLSSYGYGAAHPLTDATSFLWLPHRGRQLTATDVFLSESGWQQHLIPLTIERLKSQPDLDVWDGDELEKAVSSGIANPASWSISRKGLTVTFGQYAVAPYGAGMPQVQFTWDELRPFLDPALQPDMLPARLPETP